MPVTRENALRRDSTDYSPSRGPSSTISYMVALSRSLGGAPELLVNSVQAGNLGGWEGRAVLQNPITAPWATRVGDVCEETQALPEVYMAARTRGIRQICANNCSLAVLRSPMAAECTVGGKRQLTRCAFPYQG